VGKVVKLSGLPFTIIGTFRERVDTFGRSEVTNNSMMIPYTVTRYFTNSPELRQLYFSAAEPSIVIPVTGKIRKVIESRHRPESAHAANGYLCLPLRCVNPTLHIHPDATSSFLKPGHLTDDGDFLAFRAMPNDARG
jgi:hypothetical protein